MAVKVKFEIGHTAKLKSKKTSEGFTHDWELYVRGCGKGEIVLFVDKVVFNLHDSFPKPKRTLKEPPFLIKESGYAGFTLTVDVYFKSRDEPRRITYSYDLDLQQTGPPVSKTEIKEYVFHNPSEEFRQKLIKSGGVPLIPHTDEKSRDSLDEQRSQYLNKPKLSSDIGKKLKIRPDDSKLQTFANLFGTPITKTTPKVSPDPKAKGSPLNLNSNTSGIKSASTSNNTSNNRNQEKSNSAISSSSSKEKNDKKDRHKHNSPYKEKVDKDIASNKKSTVLDDKHDRRDDKKKDKSHSKDRSNIHSKDKSSKRLPSPINTNKRYLSPKRSSSPVRSSSAASKEENTPKSTSKLFVDDLESKKISSSSGKKSKKDKKSHEKDKERERKEKDRDKKEKDDRLSRNNTPVHMPVTNQSVGVGSGGFHPKGNTDLKLDAIKKDKISTTPQVKEIKELKNKIDTKTENPTLANNDKKIIEKHDKDIEKKHKHKKKEKNKEKDKEKDSLKDKKKEKSSKHKDDLNSKKGSQNVSGAVQSTFDPILTSQSKSSSNTIKQSDSSDSESGSVSQARSSTATKDITNDQSDSSSSSFPDITHSTKISIASTPPNLLPSRQLAEETKRDKKEKKIREKSKLTESKEDKKRKRKARDEPTQSPSLAPPPTAGSPYLRKSVSPALSSNHLEPPEKKFRRNDTEKNSRSPLLSATTSQNAILNTSSPQRNDSATFRAPLNTVSATNNSSTVTNLNNINNDNHNSLLTVDYISELRELQHKIMTLQDNNHLQQVVEMIAATGRFEMTQKTFDFDLCALDRTTVQRLQDFLATSVS